MPSRSLVVFDNDPTNTCTTPCNVTLPLGRHTFTVRSDGYREARRIIEVPNDTSATVELARMMGTLSLMTTPPGLTAIIDGQEQARKTPLSVNLPVGQHRVQVVRGADRQELVVNIADGELSAQTIEWK
jgi:hypothetical protein